MFHALHLTLVLAAGGLPPAMAARAASEAHATEVAEALDAQGRQAEAMDDFAAAVDFYKKALATDPTSPLAKFAKERVDWLETRSEDGYRPLVELTKEKRIHLIQLQRAEVERFERVVEDFPRGVVRRESRAWIAERWLRTIRDPAKAIQAHKAWLDEPGLDDVEKLLAKAGLDQAEKNAAMPPPPPHVAPPRPPTDNADGHEGPSLVRVRRAGDISSVTILLLAGVTAMVLRSRQPGRVRTVGVIGTGLLACLALAFLLLAQTSLIDPVLRSLGQ